jgi:hypothetical protein
VPPSLVGTRAAPEHRIGHNMGDKDRDPKDLESRRKNVEPDPGTGRRSLAHWQNLARVRRSLAADNGAQEQYRLDPVTYM